MQQPAFPSHIVPILSGGGTRLPAHIGILQALHDLNIQYTSIVGVSGGSIIAALTAKGFSLAELKALAIKTDFKQFVDISLWRLLKQGGLASGDKLEQWLDTLLEGDTFATLAYPLHILATDVNGGGPVLFNRENTPDVKVSQAVRSSMSIPLIFSFKEFGDQLLVDGAILSEDALFRDWQQDGTPSVCFRLRSEQKKEALHRKGRFPLPLYLTMLTRTFMSALAREYVDSRFWHSTIIVNTGTISAVDFKAGEDTKLALYELGYNTALAYLPKKLQSRVALPDQPVHALT
ncbi:patatin-like phospholipase family protein [Salinimonas sediminis]|uniref:Phospholipase n=1 Tax=Salinimonas sediminis TaxID=2303538 RepID=A0A346NNF4_9ALTE|nr:patatin-like phospholipase family protein [Salinimonas sediminis]AXR07061.1 phospholipase [Salinimonas sediminis]